MKTYAIACLVFTLWFAPTSFAATISIDVGEHELLPNQAGQEVLLYVSPVGGAVDIDGVTLYARIGDGISPTPVPAPTITDLDILGTSERPTIFFDNNTGAPDFDPEPEDPPLPYFEFRSTTTLAGQFVNLTSESLLAILTLDTTGVSNGRWDLELLDPDGWETEFAGLTVDLVKGAISVAEIPEPNTLTLAIIGLVLVGGCCLRTKISERQRSKPM